MPKEGHEQPTYMRNIGFVMRIAYSAGGRQEYIGFAYPNPETTPDASAIWSIYKLTYDGSGRMTHRYYASGTDAFTKQWTLRATYTYA